MSRFGVYRTPNSDSLLLDVQSDLLGQLDTRVVVPLYPLEQAPPKADGLNPIFSIDDVTYMMATEQISAVPQKLLDEPVTTLSDKFAEVTGALDFLFQGF